MIRDSPWPVTVLLAVLVLWAPLPFGSVTPWAVALLQVAAPALLALALATTPGWRALRPGAAPATALAAVALLGLAQSLPWPPGVARLLSPRHFDLYRGAARLLSQEGAEPPAVPLTVAPEVSRWTALTWLAVAAVLLAAAVAGRRRGPRRLLAAALVTAALFQVLYGARGWFVQSNQIWGVMVEGDASRLRGTFVNANHLATYLEMALAVAFAASWWSLRRARYALRLEDKLLLGAPPVVLWLTLFVGLAFTGSRAGLVAAVTGTVLQGALLAVSRRSWRPALAVGLLAAAGFAGVAFTGFREGLRRWGEASAGGGMTFRLEAYAGALELWRRFPWTGTGLGTFREAFPLVQPVGITGTWWHLHGDPLELLVTAGLLGALTMAVGLAALLRRLWEVLLAGGRAEDRAAALAAWGALAAVGAHELVDFGLTMPANAVTLAALAGAASAAGVRARAGRPGPPEASSFG